MNLRICYDSVNSEEIEPPRYATLPVSGMQTMKLIHAQTNVDSNGGGRLERSVSLVFSFIRSRGDSTDFKFLETLIGFLVLFGVFTES